MEITQSRQSSRAKIRIRIMAPASPVSSHIIEKIISLVASGTNPSFCALFMIRRMRVVACNAPNLFGSMIVIGVMAQISMQVVLNIAVVTNSMPNTGVSLPFISYGGTSLVFLMAEMGLVFSVSKSVKKIR